MRLSLALGAVLGAAVFGGCTSSGGASDKDLEGLVVAKAVAPATVDVGRATKDPQALAAAMRLPWSRAAEQLGDHRITIRTSTKLLEGTTVLEELSDTLVLERAAAGGYRAVYENSADYGREVIFEGGTLFLRPRYARWHQRAPEHDGEPAAIADEMAGAIGAQLELFAHGIELSNKGAEMIGTRPGQRIEIKLSPSPKNAPKAKVTQRAWRDGATVEAAAGELVLDDATALPLRARLDATVAFVRDGKRLTMHLTLDEHVAFEPVAIARPDPELVVATPARSHEVDERNELLKGIAPAAGKPAAKPVGAPSVPAGATGPGASPGDGKSKVP
jgi:hypothetical protein